MQALVAALIEREGEKGKREKGEKGKSNKIILMSCRTSML
jgi:hypothetical protein